MAKILIAEDDSAVSASLSDFINQMGHAAFVCPNGRNALECLYANQDIDTLITDMRMPGMDGRELVQAVREAPNLRNIPIIMISAFVSVHEIADLLKTGITFFQAKPLRLLELEENLNRCLARRRDARSDSQTA